MECTCGARDRSNVKMVSLLTKSNDAVYVINRRDRMHGIFSHTIGIIKYLERK